MLEATWQTKQKRDVISFAAVAAFSLSMYAAVVNVFPALEVLRPALLTSALAVTALVVGRVGRGYAITLDGIRGWAFAAFTALALASAAWSVNPEFSKAEAIDMAKIFAMYVAMVNVVNTPRRIAIVCGMAVVGSLAPSIGSIQYWSAGKNLVEGYRASWEGLYGDPNHLAMALVAVVPMAATFVVFSRSLLLRIVSVIAIGTAVTGVIVTYSRGGAIGLGVALLLWTFTGAKKVRSLVAVILIASAVVVFAPKSFWNRTETVADFQQDLSALGRVYAWEVASAINKDRPLLGVGIGGFRYAWKDYARPVARNYPAIVAHNVFLAVLAELGFVGFVLFLVLVSRAIAGAARAIAETETSALARGVFAGVAGYVVCQNFSGYLGSTHLFFLFALAACCDRVARTAEAERRKLAPAVPLPVGPGNVPAAPLEMDPFGAAQ